ncbi:MAG: hypothetical protein NTW87_36145 [Planctomycetota bacterium]|nr:hypothetical protein [Planctomycetota bacterium]
MVKRSLLAVLLCLLPRAALHAGEGPRRAADRQARISALKSLPDALKKAQAPYLKTLAETCQWLIGLQAKTDATTLVAELEGLDDKHPALAGLKKGLEAITVPVIFEEAKQKELATRVKAARKSRATGLADVAATYYRAGLTRQACDLLLQALDADPDNAVARQAFGHVKAGDVWKDPFSAQLLQKGNAYVPECGWVPAAAVDRVKNGEWFENGKWMPIADADKQHAAGATPWVIETQHCTLRSTVCRKDSVQMTERMEGMWQAAGREYTDFFLRERRPPQMSLSPAMAKKLLVHVFAEKKDYDALLKREFKNPAVLGLMLLYPGMYMPLGHASYFHREVPEPLLSLFPYYTQNQWAEQIVGEYTQVPIVNGPKPWVTKALSEALQYAVPDDKGHWTVPTGRKHPAVAKAAERAQQNTLPDLAKLMTLDSTFFNMPGNPDNSQISAALCRFLLETKDGVYALDFLEFAYDAYKSSKTANLHDYVGMDSAALEKEFLEYVKQ